MEKQIYEKSTRTCTRAKLVPGIDEDVPSPPEPPGAHPTRIYEDIHSSDQRTAQQSKLQPSHRTSADVAIGSPSN
jgi:hypothetical protein